MQNGVELEAATVFTNYETFETVVENQFKEVAPGTTIEVKTAYVLSDTSSTVEATFEQLFGKKNGKITIDTSTLSREEAVGADSTEDGGLTTSAASDDALLDWWNGEWYGWWMMTGCTGSYESMEGQWWDICGIIDIGADYTGTVTLWDEDYKKDNPMVSATVSLSTAGTGENGTMTSEGGWFTDVALEHADWIVDPGLVERDNMIYIDGWYENGDDGYYYEIYLRPWGLRWDDAGEDYLPYLYDDWYLPLIDAGKSMPDSIEMDDSAGSSNTDAAITTSSANVPGGDGIVTEEQVQMGYVWMNKVNNNILAWKVSLSKKSTAII